MKICNKCGRIVYNIGAIDVPHDCKKIEMR